MRSLDFWRLDSARVTISIQAANQRRKKKKKEKKQKTRFNLFSKELQELKFTHC